MITAILEWQIEVVSNVCLSAENLWIHNLIDRFEGNIHLLATNMGIRFDFLDLSRSQGVGGCKGLGCLLFLFPLLLAFLLAWCHVIRLLWVLRHSFRGHH